LPGIGHLLTRTLTAWTVLCAPRDGCRMPETSDARDPVAGILRFEKNN
jgi:hypothetical protein